jgi:hypothetical protein
LLTRRRYESHGPSLRRERLRSLQIALLRAQRKARERPWAELEPTDETRLPRA